MKVYVVTSGSYSDYRIHAVYTQKELANDYIEKFNQTRLYDFAEIEEYESDQPYKTGVGYSVEMTRTGEVIFCQPYAYILPDDNGDFGPHWGLFCKPHSMLFRIMESDQDKAIKIANEQRLQLIAADRWGENYYK